VRVPTRNRCSPGRPESDAGSVLCVPRVAGAQLENILSWLGVSASRRARPIERLIYGLACSVSAGLRRKPLRYLAILAPVAQMDRASDYGLSSIERFADQGKRRSATSVNPRIRRWDARPLRPRSRMVPTCGNSQALETTRSRSPRRGAGREAERDRGLGRPLLAGHRRGQAAVATTVLVDVV